jgi:hypothetical protein
MVRKTCIRLNIGTITHARKAKPFMIANRSKKLSFIQDDNSKKNAREVKSR